MNALRKRELLLSMKYCTIEACFSVPMLNLTTGNLPFSIGFAVKVLGWNAAGVGLLAATPFLCLFLQPPITYVLYRFFSLYEIMVLGFLVNALPWTLVNFFPGLGQHAHWMFAAIVMVSTLGNSVCGVAWSASVSELVPLAVRGRFFGTRNLIFGFWTLVVVLAAGQIVDAYHNSMRVFGIIFTLASAARLLGLFFLTRMKFPSVVTERQMENAPLSTFLEVFRDGNFVRLLLFTGLFGLCLNLGSPFYSVYVLKELPLSVGDLTILTTLSTFGGLLSMKTWGRLSDRFGNKPIMVTSALTWLTTAAISWLVSGPDRYLHLYVNYFITGFMIAGFQQLGQFSLMIKMVPPQNKAHYLSVYFSFTNMLIALGPITGGAILQLLPHQVGTLLGQPITKYHLLIVGSLGLCILTLHLLQSIREPAERPVRELIAVMRQMREFNPVLGLATLAHYMFTPRGLGRLAHFSVRTLRRQKNAVSDVGEELMENGLRVITQPFKKDEQEEIKEV
ncbi:MAG: transporter [Verrucomicrobiales bacterium]|nr:transporter [Verrucomicrobiales bacterium]